MVWTFHNLVNLNSNTVFVIKSFYISIANQRVTKNKDL
jgi:hypothetical protein